MVRQEIKKQAEEKNNRKKLLIYQLIQATRALYPSKLVRNPYLNELKNLSGFEIEDELLLTDLIESITLLNGKSRESARGELTSNREDVLNSLLLLQPEGKALKTYHADHLEKLRTHYKGKPFDLVEAGMLLGKSKRTMQRLIRVYLYHGLVEKGSGAEKEYPFNKRAHYQLTELGVLVDQQEEEDIFKVMYEEYDEDTNDYSKPHQFFYDVNE